MPEDAAHARGSARVLVADACLLTAAALCVLVFLPPLALLIGPGAVWVLHDRRLDRTAVIGGLIGIVVGIVAVGACLVVAALVFDLLGPVGGSESTVPAAALAVVATGFLVLLVALDVAAVRDLMPSRRVSTRLDIARLVSTAVIVVFVSVMGFLQVTRPNGEYGDAGVFALGAGAVGAVTMMVMSAVHARADRRGGVGTEGGA